MKRVLREVIWVGYDVQVIENVGRGGIVHVAQARGAEPSHGIEVWFEQEEHEMNGEGDYHLTVFGTGHPVPDEHVHIGTVVTDRGFVWHVYRIMY